jgi:hypothetical protein
LLNQPRYSTIASSSSDVAGSSPARSIVTKPCIRSENDAVTTATRAVGGPSGALAHEQAHGAVATDPDSPLRGPTDADRNSPRKAHSYRKRDCLKHSGDRQQCLVQRARDPSQFLSRVFTPAREVVASPPEQIRTARRIALPPRCARESRAGLPRRRGRRSWWRRRRETHHLVRACRYNLARSSPRSTRVPDYYAPESIVKPAFGGRYALPWTVACPARARRGGSLRSRPRARVGQRGFRELESGRATGNGSVPGRARR